MEQEMMVLAGLYAGFEIIKWVLAYKQKVQECFMSIDNQRKLDDLHSWYSEGKKFEQEKIIEMLRDISRNQEATARLLSDLVKEVRH